MKKLLIAVLTIGLLTLGTTRTAKAETGALDPLIGAAVAIAVLDGAAMTGGVTTAIGSGVHAGRGDTSRAWFISSYVFGAINILPAIGWGSVVATSSGGDNGVALGLTIGHASVAAFNFVAPTVGFVRGSDGPRLAPVAVGGTDAGGRKWFGAGLQLSRF